MKRIENRPARFGRRAPGAVGVDLGSTAVRAFEVSYRSGGPVVENFGSVPVSPGAVRGGVVEDGKAVTAAVRELWSRQKFRSRQVVLGLTHQQVLVRDLTVPKLDGKDLALALPFLVRDTLPFAVDDALLDFHPLGPAADGSGGTDGLVVAAPREAVVHAVEAVERAGVQVESVDLASFAAMRATAGDTGLAEVVIDIGAYATNLVVHVDGVPRIVRCVPRGGAEITALIALRHDLSIDEAEARKCEVGLRPRADHPDDRDVADTVGEALRPLFRDMRSSVSWFTSHHPDVDIATVHLCGGGAALPGLAETVSQRLETSVQLSDPLARLRGRRRDRQKQAAFEGFGTSAAVSVGLTLGRTR